MDKTRYKVWRSLTEPIIYHGITFDYVVALCLFCMTVYVFSFNSLIVTFGSFLIGLVFGYVMSRRDKRWFGILLINIRHFGARAFGRTRYVR